MFSLNKKSDSQLVNGEEKIVDQKRIKFKQALRAPLSSRIIGVGVLISLLLNLGMWVILYIFIKPSPEPIYLHYNIYFGIDLIGEWYKIYLIPLTGLIVILVNYLAGVIMYSSKRVLSYLVVIFAIPVNLFLALSAILLAFINR
ncbi:hypothetical protein KKB10_02075 [Patescibacteria group bacterium]|nr:hypothetical protein [Patescibacteria group bacterium]MBU1075076.1 hypothetical protein [Patescibacteria group bacterium]MBU1952359.1 hypothetical protein [Patescibacteria group bacterium]